MMKPSMAAPSALLGLILGATAIEAQTALPAGGEFQVNTYTPGSQRYPAVAMQPDGGFGIVWQSQESTWDTDRSSIEARLFAADGSPRAAQGPVNTYTTGDQTRPAIAADGDGNFIVVWESDGSSGTDTHLTSVQAQRFNAGGLPIGTQFQVNTGTSLYQLRPAVAVDTAGAFIVVWQSGYFDYDVRGQLFAADGSHIGGEFQINSFTTGSQGEPAVAAAGEGRFVVVWESAGSNGTDASGSSIQGRLIGSSGAPLGPQAQVNTYVTGAQSYPAVASNAEGAFVVVWQSRGSSGTDQDSFSIQGRLYAANGAPVGMEGQVNTYTPGAQTRPAVAASARGDFVVTWESESSTDDDHEGFSIQGRLYASNALPIGLQAQINSYTASHQRRAAPAMAQHGDFVVVWDSDGSSGSDDDGTSIQGQLYILPLFLDGFESGDTGAWSSVSP